MTTYQEPPLQSRRAARAAEDASAENTAATHPSTSSNPVTPTSSPEPLNYATTSRPPLPQYDGQNLRPRRTVESADDTAHGDLPPTQALPRQDAPNYRSRDFSPEGRRAAAPSWAPQYEGAAVPETAPDAQVPAPVSEAPASVAVEPVAQAAAGEHTMTRRELRALREANGGEDPVFMTPIRVADPITPAPVTEEPAATQSVAEADASAAGVAPAAPSAAELLAAAPTPLVEPAPPTPPTPQPSSRLDSALAEFDALAAGREPVVSSPDAPVPVTGRRAALPPDAEPTGAEPTDGEPADAEPADAEFVAAEPAASSDAEFDAILEPDPLEPEAGVDSDPAEPALAELVVEAQPESGGPSTDGLTAFDALFQPPSASIPIIYDSPVADEFVVHVPEPEAAELAAAAPEAPEPAPVNPLLVAPAPQGAPALVPPPSAYPVPVDLPAPGGAPSPSAVGPAFVAPNLISPPTAPPAPSAVTPHESVPTSAEPVQPVQTVGHWSTQSDIDDAEQINDSMISRSIGAGNGAITTSALVLPSVPEHAISGPLGTNGEIMLTGSISLPDSLSELGAHPSQLDESDIDHLLDPGDHQVANTDSTPVRAIRAVSTHTASGGIIAPSKPRGTRGFTILIIAASVMAVVVVGLLVAGLVSGTL